MQSDQDPRIAFSSAGYFSGCFLWNFQKRAGVVSLEEYVVHVGTLDILHYWKDTHWMTCTVKLNFLNTGNDRRFSSNDQLFIECQCKSEQMHSNHDSHRKDTKNGVSLIP